MDIVETAPRRLRRKQSSARSNTSMASAVSERSGEIRTPVHAHVEIRCLKLLVPVPSKRARRPTLEIKIEHVEGYTFPESATGNKSESDKFDISKANNAKGVKEVLVGFRIGLLAAYFTDYEVAARYKGKAPIPFPSAQCGGIACKNIGIYLGLRSSDDDGAFACKHKCRACRRNRVCKL